MSQFATITPTSDTNPADEYLLRQGSVDRKHTREKLSEGVAADILTNGLLDDTDVQKGISQKATQVQMGAGTDDATFVTPLKFRSTTATTTKTGVVELATASETQLGSATNLSVTPSGLNSRTALESRTGLIEIATQAEVNGGTDDQRAITALKLNNKTSSETRRGVIEIATQAETNAGSDNTKTITPQKLKGRDFIYTLTGTVSVSGIVTLADLWDNYEEIIIVYSNLSSTFQTHHTFFTPLIQPDDTPTQRYALYNGSDSAEVSFGNTTRTQIYVERLGDDDKLQVFARIRKY